MVNYRFCLEFATDNGVVKILSFYICLKNVKNKQFSFLNVIFFFLSFLLRGIVAFGQIL